MSKWKRTRQLPINISSILSPKSGCFLKKLKYKLPKRLCCIFCKNLQRNRLQESESHRPINLTYILGKFMKTITQLRIRQLGKDHTLRSHPGSYCQRWSCLQTSEIFMETTEYVYKDILDDTIANLVFNKLLVTISEEQTSVKGSYRK